MSALGLDLTLSVASIAVVSVSVKIIPIYGAHWTYFMQIFSNYNTNSMYHFENLVIHLTPLEASILLRSSSVALTALLQ